MERGHEALTGEVLAPSTLPRDAAMYYRYVVDREPMWRIAEHFGTSTQAVSLAVQKAAAIVPESDRMVVRQRIVAALDEAMAAATDAVRETAPSDIDGTGARYRVLGQRLRAIDTLVRVCEASAKLAGIVPLPATTDPGPVGDADRVAGQVASAVAALAALGAGGGDSDGPVPVSA